MTEPGSTDRVAVVIAAYDEATMIAEVVRGLDGYADLVVVVDDGSSDDTRDLARAAGAHALRHTINRGQGAALQTGITYALERGADYVITFDADGQHDPEDIPRLLAPLRAGEANVALGSRFLDEGSNVPLTRQLLLRAAILFTWSTSGVRLSDAHNGLRAFDRHAASQLHITLDRMAHASELVDQVARMDADFVEVPVTIRYTEYSMNKGQSSSAAIRIAFDYLLDRALKRP